MSPILPYDPKYYGDSVYTQAKGYLREYLWRKTHSETGVLRMLRDLHRRKAGDIFVSLMQKPGDAQLRFHSEYRANNPYLREVMSSFACHADKTALLVIKQHPLDYGIENSKVLFNELVAQHGLEGRAVYIRKLTIESVLAVASGLITINSTGGLAAIEQLVPTIALGKAIYNVPGMTFQDGLDRFWTVRSAPDPQVVRAFVDYLMVQTQINGGYYSHKSLTLLTKNLSEAMLNGAMAPHFVQAKRPVHYRSFGLKTPIGPAPAAVPVRS
jgi:capsular polysaccharide export protein